MMASEQGEQVRAPVGILMLMELAEGGFRADVCPRCPAYIQGNEFAWAEHGRIVHDDPQPD